MRVAIVHDWLVTYAGSERVSSRLIALFPAGRFVQPDRFSASREDRGFLGGKKVTTSFLQRLPLARRKYQSLLAADAAGHRAIRSVGLRSGDLQQPLRGQGRASPAPISCTSATCTRPCVMPGMRSTNTWPASGLARGIKSWLRPLAAAQACACGTCAAPTASTRWWPILAFIARRIDKSYRRTATVIYPPVETEAFAAERGPRGLLPHRCRGWCPTSGSTCWCEAFAQLPERRLVVIGDGPQLKQLRRDRPAQRATAGLPERRRAAFALCERAAGVSVRRPRGLRHRAGRGPGRRLPGDCFRAWAARPRSSADWNSDRPTGVLFDEQTAESVVEADARVRSANGSGSLPAECRANALRFSAERFRQEFYDLVMALPGVSRAA